MPLNIKDEVLHNKARELAALKGTTIAAAVREAVDDKLTQVRNGTDKPRKASLEELRAIAKQASVGFGPDAHSSDHADLYDEDGLPA